MQTISGWHINPDAGDDEVYSVLAQDRVWNCFALADLEPPLRRYSQFAVARREGSDACAVCLLLRHPVIGTVISPFGVEEGVAALLEQIDLPERVLLQVQERHVPIVQQYYRPETMWRTLLRMGVTVDTLNAVEALPPQRVRELTVADLPELEELYRQLPEGRFEPDLFAAAVFVGIAEGERIVAAGGTHALTPKYGIAVLGNIFTRPEARGQGYATAVTHSLAEKLFERGFSLVVLNVFEDNEGALRIYRRLGFQMGHRLLTGRGVIPRLSQFQQSTSGL